MRIRILLFILTLNFLGCSHSTNFRSSHFSVPVVSENQWGGAAAMASTSATKVTLINNLTQTPPDRSTVKINEDISNSELFMLNNNGVDIKMSPYNGLEVYLQNLLLGVHWQFLNPGAKSNSWVGSLQGAMGTKSVSSDTIVSGSKVKADSDITTSQAGVSLGYYVDNSLVSYFSFIYELHDTKTTVTSGSTNYGPYRDIGVHQYYGLGVSSTGKGLLYGIEYNLISISWERTAVQYQNAIGARVGFAW